MSGIAFTESGAGPAAGSDGGRWLASGRLRRAGLRVLLGLVPVVALVGVAAGPASAAQWDADKLGKVLRISPSSGTSNYRVRRHLREACWLRRRADRCD